MTDADARSLGLRAIASGRWEHRAGALCILGDSEPVRLLTLTKTIYDDRPKAPALYWLDDQLNSGYVYMPGTQERDPAWLPLVPDFRDAATVGVLVARVRGLWGQYAHATIDVGGWTMRNCIRPPNPRDTVSLGIWDRRTEAHALVAALEAAPERA